MKLEFNAAKNGKSGSCLGFLFKSVCEHAYIYMYISIAIYISIYLYPQVRDEAIVYHKTTTESPPPTSASSSSRCARL